MNAAETPLRQHRRDRRSNLRRFSMLRQLTCCSASAKYIRTVVVFLLLLLLLGDLETLSAIAPPSILPDYDRRITQHIGGTVRLDCPVTADPAPLVTWWKDGTEINHIGWERHRVIEQQDDRSQLRVRPVTLADSGLYVCRATNGFGSVDAWFRLIVLPGDWNETMNGFDGDNIGQAPQFVDVDHMIDHVTATAGTMERLTCSSTGRPRPEVTWYRDGVRMRSTPSVAFIVDNDADDSDADDDDGLARVDLALRDLTSIDSGQYLCTASNIHGNVSFTYNLLVIETPDDRPEFVVPYPDNVSVSYGGTASLLCRVQSVTVPHIQWLKRVDAPFDASNDDSEDQETLITSELERYVAIPTNRSSDDSSGSELESATVARRDGTYINKLTVRRATEKHAGQYVCSCSNSAGYVYRQAYLTVLTPRPSSHQPIFYHAPASSSLDTILPVFIAVIIIVSIAFLAVVAFVIHRRHQLDLISAGRRRFSVDKSTLVPTVTVVGGLQTMGGSSTAGSSESAVGLLPAGSASGPAGVRSVGVDAVDRTRRGQRRESARPRGTLSPWEVGLSTMAVRQDGRLGGRTRGRGGGGASKPPPPLPSARETVGGGPLLGERRNSSSGGETDEDERASLAIWTTPPPPPSINESLTRLKYCTTTTS